MLSEITLPSPRNAIKYGVTKLVQLQAASTTADIIADHTDRDQNDIVVKVPSIMIGAYIGDMVKPYTDRVVDHVGDKIAARRAKKADKENSETPS